MSQREPVAVNLLDKSLHILALFTPEQPSWGVADVARALGIPKSTVYRILRVFQEHGYLNQDHETKKFRLGLTALRLGWSAHESIELRQVAAPIMAELSDLSGETVCLQVLTSDRDQIVCIERAQQRGGLHLFLEVGATAPLHAGAAAKVLLAGMRDDEIEEVLARPLAQLAPHTITDRATLRRELEETRRDHYAVSFEETDIGAAGVAVPIADYTGQIVASLAIAGPTARIKREDLDQYISMAQQAAHRIGTRLGNRDAAPQSARRTSPAGRGSPDGRRTARAAGAAAR